MAIFKKTLRQVKAEIEAYVAENPSINERPSGGFFQAFYFYAVKSGRDFVLVGQDWERATDDSGDMYHIYGDDGRPLVVSKIGDIYKYSVEILGAVPNKEDEYMRVCQWYGLREADALEYLPKAIVTAAQKAREVSKLRRVEAKQAGMIADIDAQISAMAGWEGMNAAHAARKAGLVERRALIVESGAQIAARIVELSPP